jgi:hypothetical protein
MSGHAAWRCTCWKCKARKQEARREARKDARGPWALTGRRLVAARERRSLASRDMRERIRQAPPPSDRVAARERAAWVRHAELARLLASAALEKIAGS